MVNNKIKIDKNKWESNRPLSYYIKQLSDIKFDKSFNKINDKLNNVRGMSGFEYTSIDHQFQKADELLETLCYYIDETLEDINDYIDEPFYNQFDNKNGILEKFEKINLDDYQTKNNLGIKEHITNQVYDYPTGTYKTENKSYKKETIGFSDLLNNMEVKGYKGMPSFSEMMEGQYQNIVSNSSLNLSYKEYVEAILHNSDIQHTVDRGWLNFVSDALDTIGIVSAVSIFSGENFITGEILTSKEKDGAIFNTVLNVGLLVVTVATAGTGSFTYGVKAGISATVSNVSKALAVDMISGVAGLATINILDAAGSPELLSMVVGLGVSFIGGYYGNKGIQSIGSGDVYETVITPEIKSKILEGQRRTPFKNELIGGHSPDINNSNSNYAVEVRQINPDGTSNVRFTTQYLDGNLSNIKNSTIFPDAWSNDEIIQSIKKVGDTPYIGIRASDGATLHREVIDGVQIEVIKIGDIVVSGYPTGTVKTTLLPGFK